MGQLLSMVPHVVRITTIARPALTNYEARGVTQTGKMGDEPYRAYGLTGKNQICGIADSGINDLSCFFLGAFIVFFSNICWQQRP